MATAAARSLVLLAVATATTNPVLTFFAVWELIRTLERHWEQP